MFKIGEFSKIGQVTVETLRHYDRVGLLNPADVDRFTGYRTYSAKQLKALQQIQALKELGLSLAEIARILQNELTDEELQGMLKIQQQVAEVELETAQLRLNRIKARLTYLNSEDNMTQYEVTLKSVEAQTLATIREQVPTVDQMPERCGALFDTLAQWMVENKLPFGPAMTTYLNESYTRENIDIECAFVVPNGNAAVSAPAPTPIEVRQVDTLPEVAFTIVADDFHKKVDGLTPAYKAIGEWIEANNYQIVGPTREIFHGSPQAGDLTAEIQFPVATR